MKYEVILLIPHASLRYYQELLDLPVSDTEDQNKEWHIAHSIGFPDGMVMDIKCCGGCQIAAWAEAVLFIPSGANALSQVAFTETMESYEGEWEFECDDNCYCVYIIDGGDIPCPHLKSPDPSIPLPAGWTLNKK